MKKTPSEGIGAPILRKEDARLLTGKGSFSDAAISPGRPTAMLRSPHAHASRG
jgi:carbon-monoxide dehydrogenase large subunit